MMLTLEAPERYPVLHRAAKLMPSVFWVRPSLLFLETLEEFIAGWQVKRDQTRRGIVEVRG